MATKEELQTEANAEIEAAKPLYKQVNNVRSELSDADYAQAKVDLGNSKWHKQQFDYIQKRQEAYGSLGDQLDMQYKDLLNGTTTWKDHIATVKSDNPKPA
jgi:ribosomal protein L22